MATLDEIWVKMPNKKRQAEVVEKAMLDAIRKDSGEIQKQAEELNKDAVKDLGVYDTGNLQSKTGAEVIIKPKRVIIRFFTRDVPYSVLAYYGLANHESKGARKWLDLAVQRFLIKYNIK